MNTIFSNPKPILQCVVYFISLISILGYPSQLSSQVVINEIQPAPNTGENEWIELYNNSDIDFECIGCELSNDKTRKKLPDFIIPSHRYCIITRDSLRLQTQYPIPDSTIFIQFINPALKNTADAVVLRDVNLNVIDSVYYMTRWHGRGISMERIDMTKPALTAENWAKCMNPLGGSPGIRNSMAINTRDIAILGAKQIPSGVEIIIKNVGKTAAQGFDVVINDQFTRCNAMQNIDFIEVDEEIKVLFENKAIQRCIGDFDTIKLKATHNYTADENPLNATQYVTFIADSMQQSYDFDGEIEIEPNPFSPNTAGRNRRCQIKYSTDKNEVMVSCKIFAPNGGLVIDIANNIKMQGEGSFWWNGENESGYIVQPGAYVAFLELNDTKTGNSKILKAAVFLAE